MLAPRSHADRLGVLHRQSGRLVRIAGNALDSQSACSRQHWLRGFPAMSC
jgi:hypothetical protein